MIKRTFWISVNTVFEFLKDRSVTGFLFVGMLFIMGGYVVADLSFVEKQRMYVDTGLGAIFIVSVFITLLAGTNVIDREIREKQALCALSKPISRTSWMTGKLLGFIFTVGIVISILTTFLFFYVKLMLGVWIPMLFVGGFYIFLEMVVLSSYIMIFSMITTQYMSLFFSLMVLIIGHMVDDLKIYWSSGSAAAKFVSHALFYILPNLKFYLSNPVVNGKILSVSDFTFQLTVSALIYLAISAILSGLIFSRKELV